MKYRIGNLVPSSNLKVEPILAQLSINDRFRLDMMYHRISVQSIDGSRASDSQFSADRLYEASRLLLDAKPHAVIWHGTSAMYCDVGEDREFIRRLRDEHGVFAITTTLAVADYVNELRPRRVFLLSPFIEETTRKIERFFREHTCVEQIEFLTYGIRSSIEIAELPEARLATDLIEKAGDGDGLVLSPCTNIDLTAVRRHVERRIGAAVADVTEIAYRAARRRLLEDAPAPTASSGEEP